MAFLQVFENPAFGTDGLADQPAQSSKSKKPRAPHPPVQFVNVQSPTDVGSAAYNKLVRSHVMKLNRNAGRQPKSEKALVKKTSKPAPPTGTDCGSQPHGLNSLGDLALALPPDSLELFESFERAVAPCQLPFHISDGKSKPLAQTLIKAALGDEVLLNALLSVSLLTCRHQQRDPAFFRRVLGHRAKASKLLLEQFERPTKGTSDESIAAVALVSTYDLMVNSDIHAYDMHMQGLYQMTAIRGGLDALGMDGLLKTIILWGDQYRAMYQRMRPHYAIPPRQEHHPSTSVAHAGYHGTRKMWRQGLVMPDLVDTCESLAGLIIVLEQHAAGEETELKLDELLAYREELEGALRPVGWCNALGEATLETVVSATARLYMAGIISRMPFGMEAEQEKSKLPRLGRELKEAIMQECVDQEWAQSLGCLQWTFMAGSLLDAESAERQWLIKECMPVVTRLRLGNLSLEDFKFLIQGYIWSAEYCDADGREFWTESCLRISQVRFDVNKD